jgi:uncharacterized repeat protein (TIGR03803 family)
MIRSLNAYCKSAVFGGLALAIAAPFACAQAGENVLYYFGGRGLGDAAGPVSALTPDGNGNLFGTSLLGGSGCNGHRSQGCGTVWEIAADGTESVAYSFTGGADGGFPAASVTLDSAGNIYGTTTRGGTFNQGTVFEVSPQAGGGWTEQVLYSFGTNANDGAIPGDGLVMDSSGNLYGTTEQGGNLKSCLDQGCGTVFQIAPGGSETVLYRFRGTNDGWYPVGNLAMDGSGNLYGTTEYAGNTGDCSGTGCGTIYELTSTGTKKTLYTFQGWSKGDGSLPTSGLIFDPTGNIYGTTRGGGDGPGCYQGCGTVYELASNGAGGFGAEKVLYQFQGWAKGGNVDGAFPWANLLMDGSGDLFGTTQGGGEKCGCGTVFELTPNGGSYNESVLFSFNRGNGYGTTGFSPENALIEDGSGNLYGTTYSGGYRHSGVAFEITTTTAQKQ